MATEKNTIAVSSKVAVVRCDTYEERSVEAAVLEQLSFWEGLKVYFQAERRL